MSTSFLQSTRRVLLFLPTSKGLVLAFVLRSSVRALPHTCHQQKKRDLCWKQKEKKGERINQTDQLSSLLDIFFTAIPKIYPFLVPPLISDRSFLLDQTFSKINLLLPFTSNTFIFSIDFFKIIQILITKEKMLSQKQIFFYYIISSNSWKIRSKLILLAWNTNGYK